MTGGPWQSPLDDPAFVAGLRPIPSGPVVDPADRPALDLSGVDPHGRPLRIDLAGRSRPLLLVFLQVQCDGCHQFWHGLAERRQGTVDQTVPDSVDPVIVTRGPGSIDAVELAALAEGVTTVPVVMSDRAWSDYRVSGYPFFVLVHPDGPSVIGETVGFGWADVSGMVAASLDNLAGTGRPESEQHS